jgi:putative ABC transport system permease protein
VNELFGIPVDTLLVVVLAGLVVALGALAFLGLRNRVLVRLGIRNVGRRRGRTALIVLGLMLGTTIMATALATGDTMSNTIRGTAVASLGETDELVSAKGAEADLGTGLGSATGVDYFDETVAERVDEALAGTGLVDGVTPAIIEQVAVQAPVQRQTEPRVTLFAADPARMEGFGAIEGSSGQVSLAELESGEVFLNEDAAKELAVGRGERILLFAGGPPEHATVRDVVRYEGAGTADAALLMPLAEAQAFFDVPSKVRHVLVSNRGDSTGGARLTDEVVDRLEPQVEALSLDVDPAKQDAIEAADEAGSAFMAFFTTFGTFSVAAGILLIFLVFVMLAAERRGELGIARAIGTRRGHLVETFTFEGAAYDLVAALVGAILGAVVAYVMVLVMARAFDAVSGGDFDIEFAVSARSLAIAYALGVLLTLAVVAFSAWRVSMMTISTAIRNLPEPPAPRRRRRLVLALVGLALGLLLVLAAVTGDSATPLILGISLALVSLVPILRMLGVPDRLAFTGCGLALVVFLMLPWESWEAVFGPLAMDFSTWITAGLMIVVGAVWTIVFNADLLIGGAMRALGRIRRLAPVLKMSMAYPLANRFRTGTTLAMFTLVVFTLVTGVASNGSFVHALEDVDAFGGGFDVRASTSGVTPIRDVQAAVAESPELDADDFTVAAGQSFLPIEATQSGTGRPLEPYAVRGLDDAFLEHTTFDLGKVAQGYGSDREVWDAIASQPGLAVVDSIVAPRRDNWNFGGAASDFRLSGFYFDEGPLEALPLEVRDPQTGRRVRLTVIGILSETAPFEMAGISTSQATLDGAFPGRADPTIQYFALAPGVEPAEAASRLESAFLVNGMEAESIEKVMRDATAASVTFNRLIQGFLGLGLLVGVAALGVISARAVVERRQQIGVLRAIGFRQRMVQATFLLESSFIALTSIVVGTALGLLLAWNIVRDQREQPSWESLTLVIPWVNLGVIFLVVYAVALAATLAPALRASRIRPAEALRYE